MGWAEPAPSPASSLVVSSHSYCSPHSAHGAPGSVFRAMLDRQAAGEKTSTFHKFRQRWHWERSSPGEIGRAVGFTRKDLLVLCAGGGLLSGRTMSVARGHVAVAGLGRAESQGEELQGRGCLSGSGWVGQCGPGWGGRVAGKGRVQCRGWAGGGFQQKAWPWTGAGRLSSSGELCHWQGLRGLDLHPCGPQVQVSGPQRS